MPTLWIDINLKDEGGTAEDAMALRNALKQRIVAATAGSVIGGGISLDGSSCDMEVRCENPAGTEVLVRRILDDASLGHTVSFRRTGGG